MTIELSSGHVFADGSVKAVGPLEKGEYWCLFRVYGVGFTVDIHYEYNAHDAKGFEEAAAVGEARYLETKKRLLNG